MKNASFFVLWLLLTSRVLLAAEMRRSDSVLLNGDWQFARGQGTESAQTASGQKLLVWRPVTLPGHFVEWNEQDATSIRFVWVKREFEISASQANRLAVLRWNRIDYGATAFINGQQVGYNEPTGPFHVLLAKGTLRPGKNEIALKIPGAAGVRRSESGHFLFPAGLIWGPSRPRMPAVTDDIWIDFAEQAYMKWVLAIPDLAGGRVRIRVTPTSALRLDGLQLVAHVRPWPEGDVIGSGEHGTMILAEFPVLYNYRNHRYTPEEWDEFHRNTLADTAAWMARLWNHPAVIMWVLSNESRNDNEWESGPFRDFVVGLDPTRPTMRTGTTGTNTNYDVHTCGNTNHWTHEGQMHMVVDDWFEQAGNRTVTNSEYMNIFKRPKCQWTGNDDEEADRLAYAQLGMEHTEVMRRARVDAILPYMYAGWTRTRRGEVWKAGYAQPVSAAWHSALSPVLASLDLFDANYLTGQQVTTDLYLINDSWHDAMIHVDLLLTRECPEFIPEAECFERPLARWSFDFELEADALSKTTVEWKFPDRAGAYWLTARTTGVAGRPVLSQRFVRAIQPPNVPDDVKNTEFVILGDDETRRAWFRDKGLTGSSVQTKLSPERHVVLVWNPEKLSEEERGWAARLCRFASEGGCIVVLSTKSWHWPQLCDVEVNRMSGSRVFPYTGSSHSMLRGIDSECLKRWNGLPGTVAAASLKGPTVESSRRVLWVREPKHTVVAEVPTATKDGRVLISQLDLRRHVLRSVPSYDPVAEQMLVNLLSLRKDTSR